MASDIKVNNIKSYTGNTLNLGDTGDTINLTGTSFNGTSSIIWNTTPKTSAFTATAGSGFFVDTSSAAITATLPASPSAGDIVAFKDYAGTFATNNLTIARNGSNIQGNAEDALLTTNRASVILVYVDATKGWLFTNESNVGDLNISVPDAPTIGTATATGASGTATVSYTAPADDGGSPITQYTATSSPDGITGTLSQAGSGTITVTGLTNGTSYTFTVTATNSVGTSAASAASNSVTPFAPAFVSATGGTVTTSGDFKIHTFTSSGTFTVSDAGNPAGSDSVSYMVVAGGGAGGGSIGGGGGAGGFREGKATYDTYTASPLDAGSGLPVSVQGYPITIGGGGSGEPGSNGKPQAAPSGSNSVFSTITSAGGGGGGNLDTSTPFTAYNGRDGGSGGGSTIAVTPSSNGGGTGGSGNTPSVSPPQGREGASRSSYNPYNGTGGGGATGTGTGGSPSTNNPDMRIRGGAGATTSITGSPTAYAGGGGGGAHNSTSPTGGAGGTGGGGAGGNAPSSDDDGSSGTSNTGGGGGGGGHDGSGNYGSSGGGGSGVVIIRYKFQ